MFGTRNGKWKLKTGKSKSKRRGKFLPFDVQPRLALIHTKTHTQLRKKSLINGKEKYEGSKRKRKKEVEKSSEVIKRNENENKFKHLIIQKKTRKARKKRKL